MFPRLLDFLFPPRCLACRTSIQFASEGLCKSCEAAIPRETTLCCGKCFARIPEYRKICHEDFPYMLGAATRYGDTRVRALIHNLKFRHAHASATTLAKILAHYLRGIPTSLQSFSIVPIPLSPQRERERGFNQSLLIANRLSAHLHIPVLADSLIRTRHAEPQSTIGDRRARHANVAGAFAVSKPDLIAGKNILLLDDVTTSGATLFEATTALKRAGAKHILATAAARA